MPIGLPNEQSVFDHRTIQDIHEEIRDVYKRYPFELVARLLEVERQSTGMTRRAGAQKALQAVLSQEWDSESEIMDAARERQKERAWFGLASTD
jgi:hypothetical protein